MVTRSPGKNVGHLMIYADANGSLPPLPEVREHVRRRMDSDLWGNPNALHSLGMRLHEGLERCRSIAADALGADPAHLIWTSGASEGVSMILRSVLDRAPSTKRILYTPAVEHSVVLNALAHYQNDGFELRMIPVSPQGKLEMSWLENQLAKHGQQTALVSCMASQNETGVRMPWEKIRDLCRVHGIPFFSDTTQWIGRLPFHFLESGLDWAVITGHKLGALPGSGLVLARDPRGLKPLVFGGGQEEGLRGGSQNFLAAESMAIALDITKNKLKNVDAMNLARKNFETEIQRRFPATVVIGGECERLPGTTLLGYPGLHGQAVQIELESEDVFVTTSAACSDNEPATSKVLRAMGVDDALGRSVVRISLPVSATPPYEGLLRTLTHAYEKLARIKAY